MTVHPPEPGSGWDVTDHADTIRRALPDADGGAPYAATEALDALLVERQQLHEELDGMARAPYGQYQAMRERAEKAEAGRQQAQQALEGANGDVRRANVARDKALAERQQAQEKLWEQSEAAVALVKEVERLEAERQQAQEDLQHRDAQIQELCDELREAIDQRQQAIDALRQAQHHCRENIRRAAFAPEIGTRYTEKLRLAIADECRRLEDGIAAALVKLGEKQP